MKTLLSILVSVAIGAAIAGVVVSRQQTAMRAVEAAEFAKREVEFNAEKARLEKALASAKGRTVTVETPAPAAPAQVIEVAKGSAPREALERLKLLRVAPGPTQMRSIRQVINEMETLTAAGKLSLPVIREFLAQNQDIDYDTGSGAVKGKGGPSFDPRTSTEFLVPPSLR